MTAPPEKEFEISGYDYPMKVIQDGVWLRREPDKNAEGILQLEETSPFWAKHSTEWVEGGEYDDCAPGNRRIPVAYNFPYGTDSWYYGYVAAGCCVDA